MLLQLVPIVVESRMHEAFSEMIEEERSGELMMVGLVKRAWGLRVVRVPESQKYPKGPGMMSSEICNRKA